MKKKKKTTTKDLSTVSFQPPEQREEIILDNKIEQQRQPRRFPPITTLIIFTLIGVLIGILFSYGGNPLVSMVNGQPVFRWELANILFQRYGQQTLQGVVTERLIAGEAQKTGIQITQSDIDTKAQQILNSFGSELTLDDFLKFQGMQKQDFDTQIKLQLTVEKLLTKDVVINDSDISNYIATNQATLVATDPATLQEEARAAIIEEKISEKIQGWLEELKAKASIQTFL